MKFIKFYFIFILLIFNSARPDDQKDYLSQLPQELISEILKNIDVKSAINLKKTDKTLYEQVENYLNFQKNSAYVVLNGNFNELIGWVNFLTNEESKVNNNTYSMILNLNEDLNFYLSQSTGSSYKFNDFLTEISRKFPKLTRLVINKNSDGVYYSHSEIRIGKDNSLYLKGNDSEICGLLGRFYNYKDRGYISTVTFDLLKYSPSSTESMWSEGLLLGIGYYVINTNTVYVNDLDNSYFTKKTFFTREEVLDTIIRFNRVRHSVPLITEFKVVRNGVEEIYNFN